MTRRSWTYIMTNKVRGVLYVGVTTGLAERVDQHKRGAGSDFCRKYNLHRLVLAEEHGRIDDAIAREKALKAWKREWKIGLIEESNPEWADLFDLIG
ncbi:MAG TPA: GIY-YIG nuclease family protein [Sphingobium sp.]